jgi:phage protein D
MSPTASIRTSGLPENSYAPDFRVFVGGVELDPVSNGHVLTISIAMDLHHLTHASLTLNNYDDTTFDLRWSVLKPNVPNANPNPSDFTPFRIGARVEVKLGYVGHLVSMLQGEITSISANFSDGAPTLNLGVIDTLHALMNSYPPPAEVTYEKHKDWQIAQRIANRHDLHLEHDDDGPVHDLVSQRNLDDLTFLKERAARIDHHVFTHTDPDTGEEALHFVKPPDGRDDKPIRTWVLTWGSLLNTSTEPAAAVPPPSLISFTPTISSAEQVETVSVHAWDAGAKKAIDVIADATTPGVTGTSSATGPASAKGKRKVVVDAPVESEEEAKRLAESLLAEHAYRFITATGKTIGLPDLRPGDNVEIHGVGPTFGGTYFVMKATHTLDTSGLLTEFNVRKTHEGEGT